MDLISRKNYYFSISTALTAIISFLSKLSTCYDLISISIYNYTVENKKIKDKNWKESGPTSTTSNNNYFSSNSSRRPSQEFSSPPLLDPSTNTTAATMESSADNIVKVCQRIKTSATTTNDDEEIYALFEYEVYNPEMSEATSKRFKAWKYFDSESALVDYIRRDTGEPLVLPAYSLTPAQSKEIQNATRAQVSTISEEFRRFRVKAEIMKKQADAQIRELHNTNVMSATRRIEGEDLVSFVNRYIHYYNLV
jgi:hypothetical protein